MCGVFVCVLRAFDGSNDIDGSGQHIPLQRCIVCAFTSPSLMLCPLLFTTKEISEPRNLIKKL